MAMMELDLNPPEKKLRQFGLIALIMLIVIGVLLGWRFGLHQGIVAGICGVGVVLFILSRVSPTLIQPVYAGLMIVSFPIGWLISHLVMVLFYFGIITPVALLFRLFGRDVLQRRRDRQAESYWVDYPRPDSIKRYFKQF